MSSIFGKVRLATNAESVNYNQLAVTAHEQWGNHEDVQERFWISGSINGKPAVDFDGDGERDRVVCLQDVTKDRVDVRKCSIFASQLKNKKSNDGWFDLSRLNFGALNDSIRIEEVRSGDIDGDGDIDIAAKVTNGAIFVWHNRQQIPAK